MILTDLQKPIDELKKGLRSFNSPISFSMFEYTPMWYDQFTNISQISLPSCLFNIPWGLYCFTYGPTNSQGLKKWPTRYTLDDEGSRVLDGTQPQYYYTTTQLKAFTFITEIEDKQHFYIYPPTSIYFPEPPFYLYYIVLDDHDESNPSIPRIKDKLKVIEIEEIDGKYKVSTEAEHTLEITGSSNFPMLGFYRDNIDFYTNFEHSELIDENEMKIPMADRWSQWSIRPISFHQISPLRAFTYTSTVSRIFINWMFPIPYPSYTYDEWVVEPYHQYGYDTPRELIQNTLLYNLGSHQYYANADMAIPVARSLTYLSSITIGFGQSAKKHYFQMRTEIKYKVSVKEWV